MTARQIEQALLQADPTERFSLAVRLIALALAEDDVLGTEPSTLARFEEMVSSGRSGDE